MPTFKSREPIGDLLTQAVLVFPLATAALVRAHVPDDAFVVAVDAGADILRAAGRLPDRIVGDLDSVQPSTLSWAESAEVPVDRHPARKDDTDGMLALALALHHDDIIFLGAGGGRPDHALANLHLLVAAAGKARARGIDVAASTWVVTPERPLDLTLPKGRVVSMFAWGGDALGVTTRGFEYPLTDAKLDPMRPLGVSNVTAGAKQHVELVKGALLVIVPTPT